MSYTILPAPGTDYGPCSSVCPHTDCAVTRGQANTQCVICGQPIGYEVKMTTDENNRLVHLACLEAK